MPLPTAKARLYRALERLRGKLLAAAGAGETRDERPRHGAPGARAAGALDASESERVAVHLRECPACAARAEEWRRLAEGLRRLPQPRPAPALVARTREARGGDASPSVPSRP